MKLIKPLIQWFFLLALIISSTACTLPHSGEVLFEQTISALEVEIAVLATRDYHQDEIISYLATRMPPQRGTATPYPTMTPYLPILGSVLIGDGGCCVGAVAGETIDIKVAFQAANVQKAVSVNEMRSIAGGMRFGEEELMQIEWEPFQPEKAFPVYVAINWTGFYVCAQFRDAEGVVSEVYCDDISVEGSPAE
ncbi:MAG: hypothetical protein JEZ06_24950 [Anaerolineaceae bacterium]|nr:hypothetical protein [Anaerolineaceae bacterium]